LERKKGKKNPRDLGFLNFLDELKELELENVDFVVERLEFILQPQILGLPAPGLSEVIKRPTEILSLEYLPPIETYRGNVAEVILGATKTEGGTRSKSITVGGEKTPPFYIFEGEKPHPPVVVGDVFDMKISVPRPVRDHFGDAVEDPAEWARLYVEKYDADMIDLELISTDPLLKDTSAKDAARLVEEVLQAVDVPLIIGGSGSPKKDGEVLMKAAEVAEGERVLLSSATSDLYIPIAEAAVKYGHNVLAWTSLEINQQKELNRKLFEYLPKERIVIDPTSAALGYGIEYAFTIMERMRLAALYGDQELQMPLCSATSNSWAAREAWRKDPELGPRNLRGPLWETTSALAFLLAGVDMYIMLHPAAIKTLKDVSGWLMDRGSSDVNPVDWVGIEVP
jgi:acetyl-CoA decarbonylase/synthase complex subunit delta